MTKNSAFRLMMVSFAQKAKDASDEVVRKAATEIARRIIDRSPVDTGLFVGNWQFAVGEAPSGTTTTLDPDRTVTLQQISDAINSSPIGGKFYIVNNSEYGEVIEYGQYPNPPKSNTGKTINGFSKQAPAGMVRITVQEFDAIVAQAVAEVAAK